VVAEVMEDIDLEEQHLTQQEDLVAVVDVFTTTLQHQVELDHVMETLEVEYQLKEQGNHLTLDLEPDLVGELVQLGLTEVQQDPEQLVMEKLLT
tara:strand:- start:116 stop:397 length:282 start_codon:yes stop_codon:yes gene_type:complete